MPKPTEWNMKHPKVTKPTGDSDYFERMSRVIFMSGLNWQILEKKWPGIKKAFADFDINKIAQFQELEVEELMMNPDVIRNLAKIRAIIVNAKEFQIVAKEHDTFAKYLESLRKSGGEDSLKQAIAKRFAFMGKGTTVIFLFAAGEDMPETVKEWQAHHQT